MSYVTIPPEKIMISLEGRGWDLMYDYFGDPNRTIKFSLANTPLQNITNAQLKGKMIENTKSGNIIVKELSTDYISIQLGKSSTNKVPVILDRAISFAPEHQLQGDITIEPDSVTLSGPISLIEAYDSWPTTLLSLQDLNSTVQRPLALQPVNKPQITLSDKMVQIEVPVEQFTEKSLFLPIVVKNGPDSLKVFPPRVKTSFVVGLSRYDTINEKDFQLEVDLKGVPINQANSTAPILVTKRPAEVKNIQFSPKAVSFLFVEKKE